MFSSWLHISFKGHQMETCKDFTLPLQGKKRHCIASKFIVESFLKFLRFPDACLSCYQFYTGSSHSEKQHKLTPQSAR